MNVARKILENTAVQMMGKVLTAGLSIVVLKIISGYLGTAGYGDYTTIYQFLAFFGIAADFGIYTITVKEMSRDEKQIPMILGNVMGLRTALSILAMGAAVVAAYLIPSYEGTVIPLGVAIATLATFFTLLNGTVSSVLQTHLKMQYATIGLVMGKVVSVAYMGVIAYVLYTGDLVGGFYQLLWAGVAGNFVMFAITSYYTTRYARISYRFDFAFWKRIFITSLPYGVALVLNTIYFRLDVLLLTIMLPHTETLADGTLACAQAMCGDTEVGLYGVAMRFLEMLILIPIYFMNSVLPVMTRTLEEGSKKINKLMQYSFDFLMATGIPILVGGFILSVPIIMFISDPEFVGGVLHSYGSDTAVRILMFAMLFSFISTLSGFTLVVLNKQVQLMWINAVAVVFNLVSNIMVIPQWGFRGAAFTSVISEFIIVIFTIMAVKKALNFKLELGAFFKFLLSGLAMGAIVWWGLYWMEGSNFIWQIALLIPLGTVTYAMCVLGMKAVTPDMIRLLRK